MPDGLSLGLIHVRPGRSAYDQHRSRAVQMAGHGPGWTAVPNPEKRKVDSSILSLTTAFDQGKRPVQDRDPGVFSCWGLSLGPRSKRTIGGSAGTGEHAGPSRSTTSSSRAWRQTAASQCAHIPAEYSRPPRRSADRDDGIYIVQFWAACRPHARNARPCVVTQRIRQVDLGVAAFRPWPPERHAGTTMW